MYVSCLHLCNLVCVVYRPYNLYVSKCILPLSFVNANPWLFWVPVPLTHRMSHSNKNFSGRRQNSLLSWEVRPPTKDSVKGYNPVATWSLSWKFITKVIWGCWAGSVKLAFKLDGDYELLISTEWWSMRVSPDQLSRMVIKNGWCTLPCTNLS